jgi:hypothetical protein
MKLSKKFIALSVSLVLANNVLACDIHGTTGFVPKNNRYIPVGLKAAGGINEMQFNRVMDKMERLYKGTVEKMGAKFVIERNWKDGTVNAYAHQQVPGTYTIAMFGGLARHQAITEDAMALVACHELGHHIGGTPKKVDQNGDAYWATNEGQADYWGGMKCLSNYFQNENNEAVVKSMTIPAEVTANCKNIYKNNNEIAICQRVAMAGYSVGRLFNDLMGESTPVNFSTPDKSVVETTYHAHPDSQCRLDTYYSSSLCDHKFAEVVSNTDENVGVCSVKNGDQIGNRPLCWFKPQE